MMRRAFGVVVRRRGRAAALVATTFATMRSARDAAAAMRARGDGLLEARVAPVRVRVTRGAHAA